MQINQPRGPDGLPEIRKAFEFTVEKIGADLASGPLWQEYTAFLEACACLLRPSQCRPIWQLRVPLCKRVGYPVLSCEARRGSL